VRFTLGDLATAAAGQLSDPTWATNSVTGVSIDSRTIAAGELFVPLVAERDGHDFIPQAIEAGAGAFLSSIETAPEDVPSIRVADTSIALTEIGRLARSRMQGPVIGITGSVGKTSVKDLTKAACSDPGGPVVWASARSFNNEIGVPLTLANAPDDAGIVIVEMGARGLGHIAELCEIARPDIGIVTTVALAHSEVFRSLEAVAETKGELVESLPRNGMAILNADDPLVAAMATRTSAEVITFGFDPAADVRVSDVTLDSSLHPRFSLTCSQESATIRLPIAGAHMAVNAAAAVAAATAAGVPFTQAARQVANVTLSPWRMEVSTTSTGTVVINDAYNANPTSMRAALATLVETGADDLVAIVGEMAELGEEGPAEHKAITTEAGAAGVRVIAVASPGYGSEAEHVADVDGALVALGAVGPATAVLVKGSRVAGLERLAQRLVTGTH